MTATWHEFDAAPLAAPAFGVALGLAADSVLAPPLEIPLALAALALVSLFGRRSRLALVVAFAGAAAAHHQLWLTDVDARDVSRFASNTPAIVKLRGTLSEQPVLHKASRTELFGPSRRLDRARVVLRAHEFAFASDDWQSVTGRVQVVVERDAPEAESGLLDSHFVGDEVEVVGLLSQPQPPGNPGERDYAASLRNQGIRSELRITKGLDITRWNEAGTWNVDRALAGLRARLTQVLRETTPKTDTPLARALLLGDTAATERDEWDAFARTGVIHVLAISGQHLVILASAVWLVFRVCGVPRRRGAWLVLGIIIIYAALTGGRPSAARAAVMVTIMCGAVILNRTAHLANTFCLAWIVVVALDPADAASFGSLLSFLSVFVLIWGIAPLLKEKELTPAEQLRREIQPAWRHALRQIGRLISDAYIINLILTCVNTPLIISAQNVIPLASLLIGPPLVLLTTIALLSGFIQMALGLISPTLGMPFGFITGEMLGLGQAIVLLADSLPFAAIYVPSVPKAWVFGFYAILVPLILAGGVWRKRLAFMIILWTLLALIPWSRNERELRVTFLSVGHGGCAVIETPDGRTLLYDAGSMNGPDIVKRSVAPYLWSRGIRRIDEIFLSHADLDHYNAVAQILRRFTVGQVTMSPSFASKPVPEVAEVLLVLHKYKIPIRVASKGDVFRAGEVSMEVLHPPAEGPAGSENERSLVLKLIHGTHSLLLTGDLEKAGTGLLLATPPQKIDVLMAPHHGSPAAYPEYLNRWASPQLVVVSRGPRSSALVNAPNAWDTWTHGAIIIRSHASGMTAETFRTKERRVLVRGP